MNKNSFILFKRGDLSSPLRQTGAALLAFMLVLITGSSYLLLDRDPPEDPKQHA